MRAETSPSRWPGELIAMGTNTDPYQPAEGRYRRLTRGVLEVLAGRRNPVSVLTKSPLVLRDLDVLAELAAGARVRVDFSVGTLDTDVWKLTEPGTPHPMRRIEAVARLNAAGIPSGVLMGPIIPGLSDGPEQIRSVVRAAVEAAAVAVGHVVLHLGPGLRTHYLQWLALHRPDLVEAYQSWYGGRGRSADARVRNRIARLVGAALREFGGPQPMVPRSTRVKPTSSRPSQLALELL